MTVALLAVCLLTAVPPGVAVGVDDRAAIDDRAVVNSSTGIDYRLTFHRDESTVVVEYRNPTDERIDVGGYVLRVDGQRVYEANFELGAGERRTTEIDIAPGIDVTRDDHAVSFSTFGGHAQFNFTREVDSLNPGDVPTPYISDVRVVDAAVRGDRSTVVAVTVVNPSDQLYATKLAVHAVETNGSLSPASVRPGDSRTIRVPLDAEPGTKVAGEARLYTGNVTNATGAMDQVEFAGRSDGETRHWNETFRPVRPTWIDGDYRYHNDSYRRSVGEKLSDGREVGGIPIVYPVAVLVVLGLLAVRRFR